MFQNCLVADNRFSWFQLGVQSERMVFFSAKAICFIYFYCYMASMGPMLGIFLWASQVHSQESAISAVVDQILQ